MITFWMPWSSVSSKTLQSTIAAANTESRSNLSGRARALYILQSDNALRDKGFGQVGSTRDHILCAWLLQTDREYCASLQIELELMQGLSFIVYLR